MNEILLASLGISLATTSPAMASTAPLDAGCGVRVTRKICFSNTACDHVDAFLGVAVYISMEELDTIFQHSDVSPARCAGNYRGVTTKISGVTDTKLRCSFSTTPASRIMTSYYSQLGRTRTANPLYYVGPREKERFIQILLQRLREPKLEALVRNLFRPSYGGNRNFTLMYSLGAFLVSSDDDMRPSALIEHSPESLDTDEICRGKLMKAKSGGFEETSFDLLTAFRDALGKAVRDLPRQLRKRKSGHRHFDGS